MIRCPRCFQRTPDHGIHLCPTLAPVRRQRPTFVPRTTGDETPRRRGGNPQGGLGGAGRPRGTGTFSDAQIRQARNLRSKQVPWPEVIERLEVDPYLEMRLREAVRRLRRSEGAQLGRGFGGGAVSAFSDETLARALHLREAVQLSWRTIGALLRVEDYGALRMAVSYWRRKKAA